MDAELTPSQIEALESGLVSINRSARTLPLRHSDLFINLIVHISVMRAELASRRDALRN
jgi:hypothetical protein